MPGIETKMNPLTRQSFVSQAAAGLAALDLDAGDARSADAEPARTGRRSSITSADLNL